MMAGIKYWYVMYYITYQYLHVLHYITYQYFTLETNSKFASAGNRTQVAYVTGGHST